MQSLRGARIQGHFKVTAKDLTRLMRRRARAYLELVVKSRMHALLFKGEVGSNAVSSSSRPRSIPNVGLTCGQCSLVLADTNGGFIILNVF